MKITVTQSSYRVHRILYRLRLWIPATPTIRVWDEDMNCMGTLQHGRAAHFGWRR